MFAIEITYIHFLYSFSDILGMSNFKD